jgi:Mn2+/Fe2+ NRAMP family transporter
MDESRSPGFVRRFLANLGPGLITGAADDDPSGISTYSVAGAASDIPSYGPLCFLFR